MGEFEKSRRGRGERGGEEMIGKGRRVNKLEAIIQISYIPDYSNDF